MGAVVRHPKKMVVYKPPPTLCEKYQGTRMSIVISRPLEKLSDPGPSAGRGAFLMEEYYLLEPISYTCEIHYRKACGIIFKLSSQGNTVDEIAYAQRLS